MLQEELMPMKDAPPLASRIKVKLLSRLPTEQWLHQFPHGESQWGSCEFLFDPDERSYDWLVVYDDVPCRPGEQRKQAHEALACAGANTLLVTTEPSTIKIYGDNFTRQFGAVLTSQEDWALHHPGRIFSQPALHWFYGVGSRRIISYDEIASLTPAIKTKDLGMVFSPKSMRHTLHRHRYDFMQLMMKRFPDMDVFGRGANPLDDKEEALSSYRYHIAVENFIGPHHWTEKLSDAFLGLTLPFYCGCPNAMDYFPEESFIPIDIRNTEAAAFIIARAIANNEYEKRLPAILEARRLVMQEYNFFPVIAREIQRLHTPQQAKAGAVILSRHAVRHASPLSTMQDIYGKLRGRARHFSRRLLRIG
jgi:hypothetical protein